MRSVSFLLILVTSLAPAQEKKTGPERWEKTIQKFEDMDKTDPPPKSATLFVGSSSIRLWDLEKSFPDLKTINRGFGGSEVADSLYYAPRIVLKHEPKTVILYAGDNDIAGKKSSERVAKDFVSFVAAVHATLPKARILYIAIKPSIKRWELVEEMRKANALIKKQCEKSDLLEYVDIFTPMLGEEGKPRAELFVADGLHLNAKGYALWAKVLKPHLKGK